MFEVSSLDEERVRNMRQIHSGGEGAASPLANRRAKPELSPCTTHCFWSGSSFRVGGSISVSADVHATLRGSKTGVKTSGLGDPTQAPPALAPPTVSEKLCVRVCVCVRGAGPKEDP